MNTRVLLIKKGEYIFSAISPDIAFGMAPKVTGLWQNDGKQELAFIFCIRQTADSAPLADYT